jgi:hypothetical protein
MEGALGPTKGALAGMGARKGLVPHLNNQKRNEKLAKVLSILKETDVEDKPDEAETAWKCPPIKTSFSPDDDFARPGTPPPQRSVEPPKPDWCKHPSSFQLTSILTSR